MQPLTISSLRNSKCKLCEFSKQANHVCLMGTGPAPARLMFIGESPGADEDKIGEPFVGKSGMYFDSILHNCGIDRKEVFVTNVLKCHPPFNMKPNVASLEVCATNYLRKEIRLVQPELIVCLGGISAKTILQLNNIQVAAMRNKIHYTVGPMPTGIPVIVTYHPAALFHQPELLEFIVDDLESAQRMLTGEVSKPQRKVNYQQAEKLTDIAGLVEAKWIEIDLETDGKDPFLPNKQILSIQISIKEGEGYYFDWSTKLGRQLVKFLEQYPKALNGHSFKFDLKWLRVKAGLKHYGPLNDTIINIHLLDENFPDKSLDVVAGAHTEQKGHKDEFVKLIKGYIKQHKDKGEGIRAAEQRLWGTAFNSIPISKRIKYGCGDADATGKLRRVFRPQLKDQGLIPLHKLMMDSVKMFVDIECNGMAIDERLLPVMEDKWAQKIDNKTRKLNRLAPYDLNHFSWQQLTPLLYDVWKCYPHEVRVGKKKKRFTTADDALALILQDKIPDNVKQYIETLREVRKLKKQYGTYIQGMPRYLRDGLIHANWRLDGTDTGRSSCNDPNLQQIPRKGDIKQLFISRFKRGLLVQVDQSQGELRIGAHIANEPTLIRLFNTGTNDIHRSIAALGLDKPESEVTEDERYNFKQVNFAIFYGSGIKTIAQEMKNVSEDQAFRLVHKWHKLFPRWKAHVEEAEAFIVANHYVRNLFGRYRRLFVLNPSTQEGMSVLRQGINAPIQGTLADWNKMCGVHIWKELRKRKLDDKILINGEVHDSWMFDCYDMAHVEQLVPIIKEVEYLDTMKDFGFRFKVPMKVDIKIGRNWKDMEDYQ